MTAAYARDWDSLIADAAVIHHYAWTTIPATANADPGADLANNVPPTLALLEAVRRHAGRPRLVFASSGGTVYGKLRQVPAGEDHPLAPITAYGASKATVELYLRHYRAAYGLDCRVARLGNPYGAGQNSIRGQGAVTTFLHHALADLPIVIWGDGEVIRDYLHVSDAAAGMVALACAPAPNGPWIFNLASGQGISLNRILAELEGVLRHSVRVSYRPGRSFDVPVSVLNVELARALLNWSPRLSFTDGIARTIGDLQRRAVFANLD